MPISLSEIQVYIELHNVANYAALPAASSASNELWYCINSQGIRFINYKPNGWYFSDGSNWTYQETPFEASQVEVDAGTNTSKSVTPATFAGAAKWGTKVNKSGDNLFGPINANKSIDIAGGTIIDLSTSTGELVHVTGNGWTCTGFGTLQAGTERKIIFDGSGTLTHNSASLVLPDGSNIITNVGDSAIMVSEGSGNWKCILYNRASGVYSSWSPSFTGFNSNPTNVTTRYFLIGKMCHFWINMSGGTSNATTTTVTLPFNANSSAVQIMNTFIIQNSGTVATAPGRIDTRVGSNIADVYRDALKTAWTGTGVKAFFGYGVYEID